MSGLHACQSMYCAGFVEVLIGSRFQNNKVP